MYMVLYDNANDNQLYIMSIMSISRFTKGGVQWKQGAVVYIIL